ncbi:superoxide dismutase [Cu-Zn] SodC [Actinobacillus pleuropneumoniae]|uniref:Superoxide dismutase [Cu-Zn] n=1 Tax=Actinobacillus pleuropneumoniae TaxID=715 RepID=A0A9Q4H458_ACTPL|nr:superoxide dismutase [Cu-Zn] SodC [Actinobacillus pleuropneumoniae]MCL7721322.1 superoxide dismutase family protein [Actinobacillus pleuropneumoniae]MCL7727362.1 superoxide dismutase family protein [Actinobacillus pleuropneumoniae]MCL7728765.1 superoxide dismutase family protein [Actinobacillus pleuropneumoniae]MCY6368991.1 superoxide dismutase [Cu-Zn] SodC [Actinobacillus pleuropneumoniae]MCY6385865.1 superoxide dismutase [Cu-Zn] SodC [Actinobacillus pleuropneumoniae]
MKLTNLALAFTLFGASAVAFAHADHDHKKADNSAVEKLVVQVQQLDPVKGNKDVGTVEITESAYGLVFTPHLHGLAQGLHGFHIHQNPSCEPKEKDGKLVAGLGAGGHWDPKETKQHGYPWSDNAHLGDLPALFVEHDGSATNPVLAPRLKKLDEVKGHSLMIHESGDNHSDHPAPLGGGGPRMACGVIK